jgi:hypothetical protein
MELWNFIVANWDKILLVVIVLSNINKGLRDALDTTPGTDDNAWEKASTVISKVLGYLLGFRPKAK